MLPWMSESMWDTVISGSRECVTVIGPHLLASHCHGPNAELKENSIVRVLVGNANASYHCTVLKVDPVVDYTLFYSPARLDAPETSFPRAGDRYILMGASACFTNSPESVSDGMFVSDQCDELGHMRGSMSSCVGDSGGGVFSIRCKRLLSIHIGNDACASDEEAMMELKKKRHQARSHSIPVRFLNFAGAEALRKKGLATMATEKQSSTNTKNLLSKFKIIHLFTKDSICQES